MTVLRIELTFPDTMEFVTLRLTHNKEVDVVLMSKYETQVGGIVATGRARTVSAATKIAVEKLEERMAEARTRLKKR